MGRLLAVGDIHGCFDAYYELIINRIKLERSDKLVLLGDYIDRGSKSREVIDHIMELIARGYNVVPLAGNHEAMLIDAFKNPGFLPVWLLNSGTDTLISFGISDLSELEPRYVDFFLSLVYFEREGNFIFVHAGFNDDSDDPFTDYQGMIWESRPSYRNHVFDGTTIIHGHRPKTVKYVEKMIKEKSGVIPIDTGCVYINEPGFGHLSALEVNTMQLTSVSNHKI